VSTYRHRVKQNESVFSFLRQLSTWHCSRLLLSAGRAAIDQYLLTAGPTAANPHQRSAAGKRWNRRTDRRTDGRTPDRYVGRSHLRSANACLLSVARTRTTYGDRSFAVSGPVAWNSLPVELRSSDVTEETFRRHLKTFLFNCLDN